MPYLVSLVSIALLALAGSATSSTQADMDTYLSLHNTARAQYGAAPLIWNATLASKAQEWANRCVYEHSEGYLSLYGENLSTGLGTYNFSDTMSNWMDEAAFYDPSNPVGSGFTQVVWKSTTQVGCASQTCDDMIPGFLGVKFFVCKYLPPGNIAGQFPENVEA